MNRDLAYCQLDFLPDVYKRQAKDYIRHITQGFYFFLIYLTVNHENASLIIKCIDVYKRQVMEEMRPNRDASGERPSREEMEKKRNEADAKLKKILTDEQYKKYQSMRPQRGQRRGK